MGAIYLSPNGVYFKRLGTTGRPPVPKGVYDECRLDYLSDINSKVKDHSIPPELVINVDQTPSSYVSVGKQTMSAKGSKSVPIQGFTDITLTFSITLAGTFLPMQIIYSGKTKASQPRNFVFQKVSVSVRTHSIGQMRRKRSGF